MMMMMMYHFYILKTAKNDILHVIAGCQVVSEFTAIPGRCLRNSAVRNTESNMQNGRCGKVSIRVRVMV